MKRSLPRTKLTQKQYDDLIRDLRDKNFVLIMNIEHLLLNNGKIYDIGIAFLKETRYNLGIVPLYLHALEQMGKLLMIKDCKSKFDGTHYDLEEIKFLFYDHDAKIERALEELGNDCKDIFIDADDSKIGLSTRLNFLHSDIDFDGNVIKAPVVDTEKIKKAVGILKQKTM